MWNRCFGYFLETLIYEHGKAIQGIYSSGVNVGVGFGLRGKQVVLAGKRFLFCTGFFLLVDNYDGDMVSLLVGFEDECSGFWCYRPWEDLVDGCNRMIWHLRELLDC